MSKVKELSKEIRGIGEVSGYRFIRVKEDEYVYLYRVEMIDDSSVYHWEVFERRVNPVYLCEKYPRSKVFGEWAFTYRRDEYDLAIDKFNELSARCFNRGKE